MFNRCFLIDNAKVVLFSHTTKLFSLKDVKSTNYYEQRQDTVGCYLF